MQHPMTSSTPGETLLAAYLPGLVSPGEESNSGVSRKNSSGDMPGAFRATTHR